MVGAMDIGTAASARAGLHPGELKAGELKAMLTPGSKLSMAKGAKDEAFRTDFHQQMTAASMATTVPTAVLRDGGRGTSSQKTEDANVSQPACSGAQAEGDHADPRTLIVGEDAKLTEPVMTPAVDGMKVVSGKPVNKSIMPLSGVKPGEGTATPAAAAVSPDASITAPEQVAQPVVPVLPPATLVDALPTNPAVVTRASASAPPKLHTSEKGNGHKAVDPSLAADAEPEAAVQGVHAESSAFAPVGVATGFGAEAGTGASSQAAVSVGTMHAEPLAERMMANTAAPSTPATGSLDTPAHQLPSGQMGEGSAAAFGTTQPTYESGTVIGSAGSLEMELQSGAHGWVRVRAELDASTGQVSAVLLTDASHAERLHRELPALGSFLQSEQVQLSSLVVAHTVQSSPHMEGDRDGQGRQDFGEGSSRQGRGEAGSGGGERDALSGSLEMEQDSDFTAGQGGGWLNVLA